MTDEKKGHPFEVRGEIELPAPPEQVWAAIATGPGIDSWFMGHTEVDPREGGRNTFTGPGWSEQSTVTAWEPGRRFAFQADPSPDGATMAFEYLIEGRGDDGSGSATTVLRFVHSGFLGGDWESEYDALSIGDRMYLGKLDSYLRYFPGQLAVWSFLAWGPQVADGARAWSAFTQVLGLADGSGTQPGDRCRLSLGRAEPTDAVVDYVHCPHILGVRTGDSLYRLMRGYRDTIVVEQHAFTGDDHARKQSEADWQSWLATAFS